MTLLSYFVIAALAVPAVFTLRTSLGRDHGPLTALWIGVSPVTLQVGWLGLGLAILAGLRAGTWWPAALAMGLASYVGIAGLYALWQATNPGGVEPAAPGTTLRIVTANLFYRNPDGEDAWPTLEAFAPDVVVLQEVSATSGAWLPPPGWHCASVLRDDAFGTAILTREPLVEWSVVPLGDLPQLRAVLRHRKQEVVVYCVHLKAPASRSADPLWRKQFRELTQLLRAESNSRPVVVGGDFNATLLHRPFRELLADAELVDARPPRRRLAGTWPSGGAGSPFAVPRRVMSLDHLLIRGAKIRSVELLSRTSGDHLPVAVELALPR